MRGSSSPGSVMGKTEGRLATIRRSARSLHLRRRLVVAAAVLAQVSDASAAGTSSFTDPEGLAIKDRSGVVTSVPGRPLEAAEIAAAVRRDAAQLWALEQPHDIVVVVEALTWPDGSLGCPRPGFTYTQASVPGYLLEVSFGRRRAQYHASATGLWLLCPSDRSNRPESGKPVR